MGLVELPAQPNGAPCLLTQGDVLAFKVEIFEHEQVLAPLWGRFCPAAHLAAFDVVPERQKPVLNSSAATNQPSDER